MILIRICVNSGLVLISRYIAENFLATVFLKKRLKEKNKRGVAKIIFGGGK